MMKAINLMLLLSAGIFYSTHSKAVKEYAPVEVKSNTIPKFQNTLSTNGLPMTIPPRGAGPGYSSGSGGGSSSLGTASSTSGVSSQWKLSLDCKRQSEDRAKVITFTTTNINCSQLTPQYANILCNGDSGVSTGLKGTATYVSGSCTQQLVKFKPLN